VRILVVEDDPSVARFLRKGLTEASHSVEHADNGVDGARLALSDSYDAIVLDLMLPGRDGFSVLRELRDCKVRTPVICLTARDSVEDRVQGLNLGADDYLAKPFSFSELAARLNALVRRSQGMPTNPIIVGDLVIDILARCVQRAGRRIDLSPREFALIEYLGRHQGRVVARTMLLEHVWGMHQDPLTNVVDVHIKRLRKKIDDGFDQELIHTIRGVGHVLSAERK